jgi:hypothetical protein
MFSKKDNRMTYTMRDEIGGEFVERGQDFVFFRFNDMLLSRVEI